MRISSPAAQLGGASQLRVQVDDESIGTAADKQLTFDAHCHSLAAWQLIRTQQSDLSSHAWTRVISGVCDYVFVCPRSETKTGWAINTKLGTRKTVKVVWLL